MFLEEEKYLPFQLSLLVYDGTKVDRAVQSGDNHTPEQLPGHEGQGSVDRWTGNKWHDVPKFGLCLFHN